MVSFSSAAETENNSIASAPLINKNSEQLFLIYPYLRGSVYLQPHHWSHYLYPVPASGSNQQVGCLLYCISERGIKM